MVMAELTKRQRYWLEHVRRALASGAPMTSYAKSRRISIGALYNAKSQLLRRGFLRRPEPAARKVDGGAFVPVRIEPMVGMKPACRLRHRSGWELECEGLPDPQWLLALVGGEHGDAAA